MSFNLYARSFEPTHIDFQAVKYITICFNIPNFFLYYIVEVTCRNKVFDVFDVKEAKILGIKYKEDWRNAKKGDWILTSDDKVLQVLSCRQENKSDRKKPVIYIRTGYGEVPTYKQSIHAYKNKAYWEQGENYNLVRNVKPTIMQTEFARKLIKHGKFDEVGEFTQESILNAYQSVYNDNNPTMSIIRGRAILKKKSVRKLMTELMKDKFDNIGVDDNYIATNLKKFVENEKITPNVRLNALNRVSTLRGHDDKKIEQLEGSTYIAMSDGDKKLLAEVRKSLSDKELEKFMQKGDFDGITIRETTSNKRSRSKS